MKKPKDLQPPKDTNFFRGIADHLRLVWLLWTDDRISPLLKILPLGSIIYMISPFDMVIPVVDDIGIVWFFTFLFIELCPEQIVAEHRHNLAKTIQREWKETNNYDFSEDDIQDAEFEEKKE
ncbi:MAG: hypothetical protein GWN30_19750 [Gammaproteobacteria bacterium]|nr:hypothetical protein [Gammaproteobacteria bacterium]